MRTPIQLALVLPTLIVGIPALHGCQASCEDKGNCGPSVPDGGAGGSTAGTSGKGGSGGSATGGDSGATSSEGGNGASSSEGGNGGTAGSGGDVGGAGASGAGGSDPCDGACGGATPVCDPTSSTCVECLAPSDCEGPTPLCNTDANTCVECLTNEDCDDPAASKCDDGVCVGCTANPDCSHLDGLTVCDTSAEECVECTVADESPCGTKSCNPATNSCTTTDRGSVALCKPCVADSECAGGDQEDPGTRCVPMEFQGVLREGGFCLRRVVKTCSRPYTIPIVAESLSGAPSENYCGIDQDHVRCEAVLDLEASRSCPGQLDTECGCARDQDGNCTESGAGGLCRDFVVFDDQCTYQCGVDNDCPVGKSCLGNPTKFCQ